MIKLINSGIKQLSGLHLIVIMFAVIGIIFLAEFDTLLVIIQSESFQGNGLHTEFILTALHSDTVTSFTSIVTPILFSACYVDDIKYKFARYYLIRSNYMSYMLGRVLVCFLGGGGIVLLSAVLSWGISTLLFLPMEMATEKGADITVELWAVLGLLFLSGGLWSVAGIAMSTLMESKYIAYASPFVIYYLLVILCERYLPAAYLLYPPNWTNPDAWPYGAWGAAIFLLELTMVFSILFVIRAGRRLREL